MLVAKDTSRLLKAVARSTLRNKTVPKSTFAASDHFKSVDGNHENSNIASSKTMNFVSPDSDFTCYSSFASHILIKSQNTKDQDVSSNDDVQQEWSNTLSFSSPESEFSSMHFGSTSLERNMNCESTQDKSTEEARLGFFQQLEKNSQNRNSIADSLSFASAESDFCNPEFTSLLSETQKKQLENVSLLSTHKDSNQLNSMHKDNEAKVPEYLRNLRQEEALDTRNLEYQELRAHANLLHYEEPLPSKYEEATFDNDDRAIVITDAQLPFRIANVNSAWENLCGFSKDECNGKTLKCIQGEETNEAAITALMSQLLRGEEAGTVLVNYRKDGSKFLNRLRVGMLRDDHDVVTHFVGVLKEVKEMEDHFADDRSASRILA
jgi:PAS domain S-box-containing protein